MMSTSNAASVWIFRQDKNSQAVAQEAARTADNLSWKDKNGNSMNCIGQINFSEQAEHPEPRLKSGQLSLFVSEKHKSYPPKDRTCFKVTWTSPTSAPLNAVSLLRGKLARLCQEFDVGQELLTGESYVLFDQHPRLQEAKLVAAFSANGITYSAQRSHDSCYQHLVKAAEDWRLLWRIPDDDTDLLLMIEESDLLQSALEKSFLVRFWA
jgi:hypothetical protein